jgi:hypothetical protein
MPPMSLVKLPWPANQKALQFKNMKKSIRTVKSLFVANCLLWAGLAFAGGTTGVTAPEPESAALARSAGGIGDLLLGPVYLAAGDWQTEVEVTNQSTIRSTVAKVVLNDSATGEDVLDLLVYLGPGDIWRGTVSCNAGKDGCASVQLDSSDDSVLADATTFATPNRPAHYPLTKPSTVGFIGVFEEASWLLGAAPLPNNTVKARHDADVAAGVKYTEADTANILSGSVSLRNVLNGARARLPMRAWANYDNAAPLRLGANTGFGSEAGSPSFTTTGQLEKTIWNNGWDIVYDHDQGSTLVTVTFPTWRKYDAKQKGSGQSYYPFYQGQCGCVVADATTRDMSGHWISPVLFGNLPYPPPPGRQTFFKPLGLFNIVPGQDSSDAVDAVKQIGTGTFKSGWVQLLIDGYKPPDSDPASSQLPYGVPAVVTAMNWSVSNQQMSLTWWYPPYLESTFGN